ncbi:hypothetical protein AB0H43_03160 [Hamadaea sp. NPDC050747]|uniref:hypothetical protein n=1 Tax=Hamadaea sp. NPDC050747 TaxID=3155789 RepID=UPI00340623E4
MTARHRRVAYGLRDLWWRVLDAVDYVRDWYRAEFGRPEPGWETPEGLAQLRAALTASTLARPTVVAAALEAEHVEH